MNTKGKKILSYEEGGSNGLGGEDQFSSVALILSCTTTGKDPIEAWCMPLGSEDEPLCLSTDILGAALFCTEPMMLSEDEFSPLFVMAKAETEDISFEIFSLSCNPLKSVFLGAKEIITLSSDDMIYEAPTMAMGASPPVLCLCWKNHIVIIIRERGILLSYKYSYETNSLSPSFTHEFESYVVDAGLQSDATTGAGVKICALVSEPDKKDGRVIKINL